MKDTDELDELFSRLRESQPDAGAERAAAGFETRVLARVHAQRRDNGTLWYWRWSVVFGVAAIVCAAIFVRDYQTLSDQSLVSLEEDDIISIMNLF